MGLSIPAAYEWGQWGLVCNATPTIGNRRWWDWVIDVQFPPPSADLYRFPKSIPFSPRPNVAMWPRMSRAISNLFPDWPSRSGCGIFKTSFPQLQCWLYQAWLSELSIITRYDARDVTWPRAKADYQMSRSLAMTLSSDNILHAGCCIVKSFFASPESVCRRKLAAWSDWSWGTLG